MVKPTVENSPMVLSVRHILTNCLGGPGATAKADVDLHELADGDRVLLCTDGLNDMVSDVEIADVLERHPSSSDACVALVALALEHGGKDNVTVVVARYTVDPG